MSAVGHFFFLLSDFFFNYHVLEKKMSKCKERCLTPAEQLRPLPRYAYLFEEPPYQPDLARLWVLSSNLERANSGFPTQPTPGGQSQACVKGMR